MDFEWGLTVLKIFFELSNKLISFFVYLFRLIARINTNFTHFYNFHINF